MRRDDTFGVIAGQLSLTLRLMTQAELANQERAADDRTGSVTRWAGKELCGVLCQFVLAADFVLVADVAPIDTPPSGTEPDPPGPDRPVHLRLEARSQDRHELHWATAVLHSLRPPAAGPVVNQR